ncbi:MAG TPA: hypothetical protein VF792_07305 [Ktedonobacterales bacterium]
MKALRIFMGFVFLLAGFIGYLSGGMAAHAAPAAPSAAHEIAKVTLPETSIDGPAFTNGEFTFEGQTTTRSVLAWTGTDAAHHLNVMTGTDGLHYSHKIIVGQLSAHRPAVAQMSPAAGNAVILAWTGTNTSHSLNVLFDVYGESKKMTYWDENSNFAPALLFSGSTLYLAWTGTDANQSLNVAKIDITSLKMVSKTTLWNFTTISAPTLGAANTQVVLGWATKTQHLNQATSTDGVHFTSALGSGLVQTSVLAPSFILHHREGGPEFWIAWAGTDPHHTISLQWTTHFPQWPDLAGTRTFTPEWAFGAPVVDFNQGVLLVWTGTDTNHHINIARFDGF